MVDARALWLAWRTFSPKPLVVAASSLACIQTGALGSLELIGLTSGRFSGFWGRWVAWNMGGFLRAAQVAFGVETFGP
jgi:hypothetical protein